MTGSPPAEPFTTERSGVGRSAELRLARLHLRGGTYALARAELESLAGADRLDRDAVLDLAEVRWRTGDLAGAAEAASAWLAEGDSAGAALLLAHVICAEAAADRGRLGEAEAHVEGAAAGLGDRATLDAILAGIVAGAPWPWEAEVARDEPGALAGPPAEVSPLAGEPAPPAPPAPAAPAAASSAPVRGAPVAPAAAALAQAGSALVGDAPERAAVLLSLALRADRASAEAVLAALDAADAALDDAPAGANAADSRTEAGSAHDAALTFVRAEALRAAGRHDEARIAYASAERLALMPAEAGPPGSSQ